MRRLIAALVSVSAAAVATASPTETAPTAPSVPSVPMLAPAPAAEAVSPERLRLATKLIDLLHPDQVSIDANMRGWEIGMRKLLASDPSFVKLEGTYPGVSNAALEGARPVATDFAREYVRNVKALKSRIFANRLTPSELQQAIAFFEKPVGQKFARQMAERANPNAVFDKVKARSGEGIADLKVSDFQGETRKTAVKIVGDMSPSETLEVMRFGTLPVSTKFAAAGQEAEAGILDLLKNIDPKWRERQQAAVEKAAVSFIDQKPQK